MMLHFPLSETGKSSAMSSATLLNGNLTIYCKTYPVSAFWPFAEYISQIRYYSSKCGENKANRNFFVFCHLCIEHQRYLQMLLHSFKSNHGAFNSELLAA